MKLWKWFVLAIGIVTQPLCLGYVISYLKEKDMDWILWVILVVFVLTSFIWVVSH